MSIEGIGSSSRFDPALMASQMAEKLVAEFDANEDGGIDKQEFLDGLSTRGVGQEDAESIFAEIDESGAGKITQSDIENAMKKLAANNPPPEGMPPPPPPPEETEEADGDSSTTSTTYEKADKNKDGDVTIQEQLEYLLTHPEDPAQSVSMPSGSVVNVSA